MNLIQCLFWFGCPNLSMIIYELPSSGRSTEIRNIWVATAKQKTLEMTDQFRCFVMRPNRMKKKAMKRGNNE